VAWAYNAIAFAMSLLCRMLYCSACNSFVVMLGRSST